ncbi:MAG: Transcription-repair coupling factor, partial [uncultured Solirubrobacteraceae bacterium]
VATPAAAPSLPRRGRLEAVGRRRARLRVPIRAGLADRRAGRPRSAQTDGRRRRRRPLGARPRRRPAGVATAADRPLLSQPRRHLRVAPLAPAASGRPAGRRPRCAARPGRGQRGARHRGLGSRALGEGPRPRAASSRLRAAQGRPARHRRVRRPARRRRLRARRPGRGARPVRRPRRPARHLSGHRGPGGPRRSLRHRDRLAALVLDLHPALARRHRRRRDRARRRARRRPRRRDGAARGRRRSAGPGRGNRGGPPRRRRAAPGRSLPAAARADARAGRRAAGRRGRRRTGAARPLGRRLRGLPRHRRAPPLREARSHPRGARHAGGRPPVLDLRRSADRGPRAGRRLRGALAEDRRARAREARALRLHDAGHLAAARRRRASGLQPRPAARGLGSGQARGPRLRRSQPPRRLHRPSAQARRHPRAPAAAPAQGRQALHPHGPRPAALLRRPAHGRHRRARGPRRRPLRRLRHQERRRRHARLPGARVPGLGQGLHAGRAAGQDLALHGRRLRQPDAVQARRQVVGDAQVARAPGRPGARGGAAQPLRRAPSAPRALLSGGLRLAAGVRGALPVPGDARPARGHRPGQDRHGVRAP